MGEEKYLKINNNTWYCVSLFYSHKEIAVVMRSATSFYTDNKELINHLSIYLSIFQGERLDLVIASENEDREFLYKRIHDYFSKTIKKYPSETTSAIPYGNMIWMDYPNNSVYWNVFDIPDFLFNNPEVRLFAMYTSLLVIDLYDEESSIDENKKTILFFLILKLIKTLNVDIADVYPTTSLGEKGVLDIIDDITDTLHTMSYYWEFDDTDSNFDLWSKQINIINTDKNTSLSEKIHSLISVFYSHLGVSLSYQQNKIVPLLVKWDKWRKELYS